MTIPGVCECGRPAGYCVKGDAEHCPAFDQDEETMVCPECGGDGMGFEDGEDCDQCWGTGRLSLCPIVNVGDDLHSILADALSDHGVPSEAK